MVDQIDELIKEVALQHGVAFSRDDPILILQTLNFLLMEENIKTQQLMLSQYKKELDEMAMHWGNDAKQKSDRILNTSLAASKELITKSIQEGTNATIKELEFSLSQTKKILHQTKYIAKLNISASIITLFAALIVTIGFLFH